MANERFHRVLLKLSGEAMVGESAFGIDPAVVERLALQRQELRLRAHQDVGEVRQAVS